MDVNYTHFLLVFIYFYKNKTNHSTLKTFLQLSNFEVLIISIKTTKTVTEYIWLKINYKNDFFLFWGRGGGGWSLCWLRLISKIWLDVLPVVTSLWCIIVCLSITGECLNNSKSVVICSKEFQLLLCISWSYRMQFRWERNVIFFIITCFDSTSRFLEHFIHICLLGTLYRRKVC